MVTKNSTFVHDRIKALLKTSKDGTKQFGLRDQLKKNTETLGGDAGQAWLRKHIKLTLFFKELMTRSDWAAADTETTAVGEAAEIIEFGIVNRDMSIAYDRILRPMRPISSGSTGVHGITNEDVEDCPTLSDEYETLSSKLREYDQLIWYNKDFDVRVCEQSTYEQGLPNLPLGKSFDIMPCVSSWLGDWNPKQRGWRWAKLEGGHRAAGDCQELIRAIDRMGTSNIPYARSLLS